MVRQCLLQTDTSDIPTVKLDVRKIINMHKCNDLLLKFHTHINNV